MSRRGRPAHRNSESASWPERRRRSSRGSEYRRDHRRRSHPRRARKRPPPGILGGSNSPVGSRHIPSRSHPQPAGQMAFLPSAPRRQSRWHSPADPWGRHTEPGGAPGLVKVSQSSWASTTPLPQTLVAISGRVAQPSRPRNERHGSLAIPNRSFKMGSPYFAGCALRPSFAAEFDEGGANRFFMVTVALCA